MDERMDERIDKRIDGESVEWYLGYVQEVDGE